MRRVPLEHVFDYVSRLANIRPRGRGFGVKGSAHTVFWPDYQNYELGLLIGMIYGDGNLISRFTARYSGKWRIEFCEGDLRLVQRYVRLAYHLFNIKPVIRDRRTWYEAYFCSRIVYEFLTFAGGHPNGKKTGKLRIPEVAMINRSTLLGFIAGLYSVEGHVKLESNIRLGLEMLEPVLVRELRKQLKIIGFNPHMYRYLKNHKMMYGLFLYGFEECQKFAEEVGLFGKRGRKLIRFLSSPRLAGLARKQPGGGAIRRL